MRPPSRTPTALALVASLSLHALVVTLTLPGGPPPGQADGREGTPVSLVTQREAAELMGVEEDRPEAPIPAATPDTGTDPREEQRPPAVMVEAATASTAVEAPRVVETAESPFVVARAGDRVGTDGSKPKARKAEAKPRAAPVGTRNLKRRSTGGKVDRDSRESPSAPKATAQGSDPMGAETQRLASRGGAGTNPGPFPPSMRDTLVSLLQQQIERCYVAPAGASTRVVLPVIGIRLTTRGALEADPRVVRSGQTAVDRSIAQAAIQAVRRCAPYRIPERFAAHYEAWRSIVAEFEFSSP